MSNVDSFVNVIRSINGTDKTLYGSGYDPDAWDAMSVAEKLEALKRGGFTGMWMEDNMDFMNDYKLTTRDRILAQLQDCLDNVKRGYDMEDYNHYVIKFSGQDKAIFSEELTRPLTEAQIRKIEWISGGGGFAPQQYWHKDKQHIKNDMISFMGFHEFQNGVEVASYGKKLKDVGFNY